jgi:hypothetical protein
MKEYVLEGKQLCSKKNIERTKRRDTFYKKQHRRILFENSNPETKEKSNSLLSFLIFQGLFTITLLQVTLPAYFLSLHFFQASFQTLFFNDIFLGASFRA